MRKPIATPGLHPTRVPGQVQVRTLVYIRWIAIGGQATALLLVHFGLGFRLPLTAALMVVAASAGLNLIVTLRHGSGARLGDRDAALYLAFDVLQLTVLLYLTGGLQNPFALLLIAPVTVSASILSHRSTITLSILAGLCASVLAILHQPLPWRGAPPELPPLFLFAAWAALVCGIVFIASYVSQVAIEARRMSDALAASQLALAREQRVSALGALAAAAAHELGSPLATIAVVAREIAKDLPPDSPIAEDAELLLSQTARCREILTELARQPEARDDFLRLPLSEIAREAAAPHARPGIALDLVRAPAAGAPEPTLARTPEIVHGLGNFLANAIQFARSRVVATVGWDEHAASIAIADDGPGYPAALVGRLGEPYLSGRGEDTEHMGLGIFIACTLLERTGAAVAFVNRPQGGAEVVVRWPRAILETFTKGAENAGAGTRG